MNSIVKAGVVLGVLVSVWMFVHGFAGWYKDVGTSYFFPIGATLILIGVVVWGLMQTAKQGRGYGGQLGAGLLICLIGGVIIVVMSFVWSTMVFKDVFEVTAQVQAETWANAGMSEQDIQNLLTQTEMTRTPVFQALMGFVMTMLTGLIVSLIAAAFIRDKH